MEKLPLDYFDRHPYGDTMSRFTNDVDTISDALNNSFAMIIQSFIQIVGTLTLIFVLNWRLSLIVFCLLHSDVLLYQIQRKEEQVYLTSSRSIWEI